MTNRSSTRTGLLSTVTPLALALMGCLVGCAQPQEPQASQEKGDSEETDKVVQPLQFDAVECEACQSIDDLPIAYVLPLSAKAKHARADAVFKWVFGGSEDPLAKYPQRTGTASDWSTFRTQIDRFRQLVANAYNNHDDGWCDINSVKGGTYGMPLKGPVYNTSNSPNVPVFATRPVPAADQIEINHAYVMCKNLSTADKNMLLPAYRYWRSEFGGSYWNYGLQATMLKVWGDPGVTRTPSTAFNGSSNYGPEIWWHEECNVNWNQNAEGRWSIQAGQSMVFDPAPAQLNYNLSAEWQYATYTTTNAATYGFKQTKNWVWHPWMPSYAGYACIDYNAAAGTVLYGYLIASGNYVKCTGW